jgi:hypothetical protein
MFQDIAFVPIQVLLVSIIVEGVLSRRDKREKLIEMERMGEKSVDNILNSKLLI